MPRKYNSLTSHDFNKSDLVQHLRHIWFNDGSDVSDHVREEIKKSCTWITETSEEFFQTREPGILHRFINSTAVVKKKLKLLSRGGMSKATVIQSMCKDNTSSDHTMTFTSLGKNNKYRNESIKFIKDMCSRISRWIDICDITNDNMVTCAAFDDLKNMSKLYKRLYSIYANTKQEALCCYILEKMQMNSHMNAYKCFQIGSTDVMWAKLYNRMNPEDNETLCYKSFFGMPVLIEYRDGLAHGVSSHAKRLLTKKMNKKLIMRKRNKMLRLMR